SSTRSPASTATSSSPRTACAPPSCAPRPARPTSRPRSPSSSASPGTTNSNPSATPAKEPPSAGSTRSSDPPPQRRPPGARGTAHRATTPCTGRETSALQGRGEPRTERQPPARDGKRQPSRGAGNRALSNNPLHGTGNVSPPGARGTAHRATTPRTGRETSTLQGRGEPRTAQQHPALDGIRHALRGARNRAQGNNPPPPTGNATPPGARGTAHTPNDRWGPAPTGSETPPTKPTAVTPCGTPTPRCAPRTRTNRSAQRSARPPAASAPPPARHPRSRPPRGPGSPR